MDKKNNRLLHIYYLLSLAIIAGLTVSCSKEESPKNAVVADAQMNVQKPASSMKNFSVDSITRGALVFQERCAECHGPQAQGHPGWTTDSTRKDKNKKTKNKSIVLAPPLDGTGVAHLRKKTQLVKVITKGGKDR